MALEGVLAAKTDGDFDNSGIIGRLQRIREARGLSQAKVAEAVSLSLSSYNNIENGKRELKAPLIIALSEFYDVSPNWLLGFGETPSDLQLSEEAVSIGAQYDSLGEDDKKSVSRFIKCLCMLSDMLGDDPSSADQPPLSKEAFKVGRAFDSLSPADKDRLDSFMRFLSFEK